MNVDDRWGDPYAGTVTASTSEQVGAGERLDALNEYREVSENLRHNGNRRDARLTLYFAIAGGLLLLVFNKGQTTMTDEIRTVLKIGGTVATSFFLLIELRLWMARTSYMARARSLEVKLNFRQYLDLKTWLEWLPFSLTLYVLFLGFWIWIVIGPAPAVGGSELSH